MHKVFVARGSQTQTPTTIPDIPPGGGPGGLGGPGPSTKVCFCFWVVLL